MKRIISRIKAKFLRLDISRKLTLSFSVLAFILLLACASTFILFQARQHRKSSEGQIRLIADIAATFLVDHVISGAPDKIHNGLEFLATAQNIKNSAVYTTEGIILDSFSHEPVMFAPGTFPLKDSNEHAIVWGDKSISVVSPIRYLDSPIGYLFIERNVDSFPSLLFQDLIIAMLLIGVGLTCAVLLASYLQQLFSRPILALVETSMKISRDGDHSLRAQRLADDELGLLADSFNSMLDTLAQRNRQISIHSKNLESVVAERTRELTQSESRLKAILESAPDGILILDAS